MTASGDQFGGRVRKIDQATIDRYAAASGDMNPIHVDVQFAARTQFGGTIAHGMLLLGYIGEMMGSQFGQAWTRPTNGCPGMLKARFRAPARAGDTVTTRGSIERIEADAAGYRRVICAIECVNERGEVLVSGEARVTTEEKELGI